MEKLPQRAYEERDACSYNEAEVAGSGPLGGEADESDLHDVEVLSYLGRRELCEMHQVEGLAAMRGLRRLTIHGCSLRSLAGMPQAHVLPLLEELNLSSNALATVEGLPELPSLRVINLSNNRLRTLAHMPRLERLERVVVSHNRLAALDFGPAFMRASNRVSEVDARDNRLGAVDAMAELGRMHGLSVLMVEGPEGCAGNGVVAQLGGRIEYRKRLACLLPSLSYIDGQPVPNSPSPGQDTARHVHDTPTRAEPCDSTAHIEVGKLDESPCDGVSPRRASSEPMLPSSSSARGPTDEQQRDEQAPRPSQASSIHVDVDMNAATSAPLVATTRDGAQSYMVEECTGPTAPNSKESSVQTEMGDAELEAQGTRCRQLEGQLIELQTKVSPLLDEIKSQIHRRQKETERAERAESELQRIQTELGSRERLLEETWKKATETLKTDADVLRGKNLTYEESNKLLQKETWQLRMALQSLQQQGSAQLSSLEQELSKSRADLSDAQKDRAMMSQTLEQSSRAAELLRAQLEEARMSTSSAQQGMQREIARQAGELEKARLALSDVRSENARLREGAERAHAESSRSVEAAVSRLNLEKEEALRIARADMQTEFEAALNNERKAAREAFDERLSDARAHVERTEVEKSVSVAETKALREELAEVRNAFERSVARGKQAEQLVQELSDVVRAQKSRLSGLQGETERNREATHQLAALRSRVAHAEERGAFASSLDRENRALRDDLCESKTKIALLQQELLILRDSMSKDTDAMPAMRSRMEHMQDAIRVKEAELQSAIDREAALQTKMKEARAASEREITRLSQALEEEMANNKDVKADFSQHVLSVEKLTEELEEAKSKLQSAEASERDAHKSLESSQSLLKYVEDEVHNVRRLFADKERKLLAELEEARDGAEEQRSITRDMRVRASEAARAAADETASLEAKIREAECARTEAEKERAAAEERLAKVEGEMRVLLTEAQRRKKESTEKVKQLIPALQMLVAT